MSGGRGSNRGTTFLRGRGRGSPRGGLIETQIRQLQASQDLLIQRAPFRRVVREIIAEVAGGSMRMEQQVCEVLQTAVEDLLDTYFTNSYRLTVNARRVTLLLRDAQTYADIHDSLFPSARLISPTIRSRLAQRARRYQREVAAARAEEAAALAAAEELLAGGGGQGSENGSEDSDSDE